MKKEDENRLLSWIIDKIKSEFKDDVSLLIGYEDDLREKAVNPEDGSTMLYKYPFDYYVPETEKAYELAKTFIIDGIGYDLYPRSWKRLENAANLSDYYPMVLGKAKVLYARSEADEKRFLELKQRLTDNLNNPQLRFIQALERINVAMTIYQTMMFSDSLGEVRLSAGSIADYTSTAIALVNGVIFMSSQVDQINELSKCKYVPENFTEYYAGIVKSNSINELKDLAYKMLKITRTFLEERKVEEKVSKNPAYIGTNLADWYYELSFTWLRIYTYCNIKDFHKAFMWGCYLQQELNVVSEEFGLKPMDLMLYYNSDDLGEFCKKAHIYENYILDSIKENNGNLRIYSSLDEFIDNN